MSVTFLALLRQEVFQVPIARLYPRAGHGSSRQLAGVQTFHKNMSGITRFQYEQMQARLGRPSTEPPATEKVLHVQIMDYCDAQWPRWKYIHSRMDKATRNELGVPDFVIVLPQGRTLYVEAKRPGEKLSLAQRDWHAEMAKLGYTVHVVHDTREFLQAVEATLNPVGQILSNPPPPKT